METRKFTAGQLADLVGGRFVGDADVPIAGVASLERAGPGDISFLASARYRPYFERCQAGAVLVTPVLSGVVAGPANRIIVPDPHAALARILTAMYPAREPSWGIHQTAVVQSGARWKGRVEIGAYAVLERGVELGSNCQIGPLAVIQEGARLGDGCRIGSQALVGAGARLGDRVVLKPGARVGTAGFAYIQKGAAGHEHIPHVGGCLVEDDVEIGANSTVDRGSVGDTVIGAGTKIDNLVQVGHNVRIGRGCLIMAQVGLAGSTTIEDDVVLAGQAGLAGHLTVGRGARVAAQAGVIGDVPAGATVSGYPARAHRDVLRQAAAIRRLAGITASLERIVENRK